MTELNNSTLHHFLLKYIIEKGYAPDSTTLSAAFKTSEAQIGKALRDLQDYHGVVLHPHQPKVWVVHPFALSPTNFYVASPKGEWWGNCAWCAFGVAVLVDEDVEIRTTIGAEREQIVLNIIGGELQEKDYWVHFPVPMKNAWDNVIYTCANQLIFRTESEVNRWAKRHHIPVGDIQPIEKIWQFSKDWYGNHLNPDWKKWTLDEAKQLFAKHDLRHPVWQLEGSGERF